jgi:hypothetical protein
MAASDTSPPANRKGEAEIEAMLADENQRGQLIVQFQQGSLGAMQQLSSLMYQCISASL